MERGRRHPRRDASSGQVGFFAQLTSTGEEALVRDFTKKGSGRLFCPDRMEMPAVLQIQTEDGALDEVLEVTAVADGGSDNLVSVTVDLGEAELEGSLMVALKDGVSFEDDALLLGIRWEEDGGGLVRGEMFFGGRATRRRRMGRG